MRPPSDDAVPPLAACSNRLLVPYSRIMFNVATERAIRLDQGFLNFFTPDVLLDFYKSHITFLPNRLNENTDRLIFMTSVQ